MTYSIYLTFALATAGRADLEATAPATPELSDLLQPVLSRIGALVERLRQGPVTPLAAAQFEKDLQHATREVGRVVTQWTYNHLEPACPEALPPEVYAEASRFRRLTQKTPQSVSTLFGTITVRRWGYRAGPAEGESVLFPVCRALGLVHGASPALVERVAQGEKGTFKFYFNDL